MSSVIPKQNNTVITATTGTGQFDFELSQHEAVQIGAYNLGAADVVNVQIKAGTSTYQNLYEDGAQVQLTQTWNARRIVGPGQFRISKPSTVNSVSVHVD